MIADRFHVAKLYKAGLDKLRKKEMKRLKDELSDEEYKKLKGVMRALRRKPKKLNDEQREILKILFEYSSVLEQVYELCNDLNSICEKNVSKAGAEGKFKAWMLKAQISGLNSFNSFLLVTKQK
ncbi:ISL3 family transposase [Desulfonema ishimotonii]|uniref:ISL3 family transposase n=1 Tax=Desulfonema ishimotonii TaxID=45657 RepID=A0A401FV73_9BACT|nr:transposase [Desulfonema ishimotonii]GBC60853.1 ISL3 family transposase [Desulfonema ishimotonii]